MAYATEGGDTLTNLETLAVVYALRDRIEAEDLVTAGLMCEHLLNVLSPLSPPIATDVCHNAADMAERQPTQIIH